ncbi:amino acid ABC transporter permease [Schumannella sp. 10F1B-5-1]|uniref:amino acid ABC transporter permease n=1 Tax=Schumannella sp. 10F1B-5-1 TaxID=2590780 RepID=UPI001130ABDC|nr:amino acid ABC transporter permease [Schumannella sp. 10F1B-5-1]TPW70281.1 amino acid ABC transporter permease [Schumannella sp. 10F1B-5-1]
MSSVLFDAPGPRARRRQVVIGAITLIVVAAILGFIVYRFAVTGQFSAQKWSIFGYQKVWSDIAGALGRTLAAFALAGVLSLVLGFILAMGRLSDHAVVRVPVMLVTELFRAIPLLILIMLFYYGLPTIGIRWSPYAAVVAGLTLYNGAVFAEIFRAGVESLPKGQREAGMAIGLRKGQLMRMILLPQAVRAMLPIIVAQLVVVLKDTALGFIVTYQELLYLAKFYGTQLQYGSPIIPSAIVMGSIYIALCLILAGVAKMLEVRLRGGRKPRGGGKRPQSPAMASTGTSVMNLSNPAGGAQA